MLPHNGRMTQRDTCKRNSNSGYHNLSPNVQNTSLTFCSLPILSIAPCFVSHRRVNEISSSFKSNTMLNSPTFRKILFDKDFYFIMESSLHNSEWRTKNNLLRNSCKNIRISNDQKRKTINEIQEKTCAFLAKNYDIGKNGIQMFSFL